MTTGNPIPTPTVIHHQIFSLQNILQILIILAAIAGAYFNTAQKTELNTQRIDIYKQQTDNQIREMRETRREDWDRFVAQTNGISLKIDKISERLDKVILAPTQK